MREKNKGSVEAVVARETAEYCIRIIPSLVDSLEKVNREIEIAALTITGNIRDMIWNRDKPEKGFSYSEMLISLQFQDIARQETERVISSLISLKEKLEWLKEHVSGDSEISCETKETAEAAAKTSKVSDEDESVVLFDYKRR